MNRYRIGTVTLATLAALGAAHPRPAAAQDLFYPSDATISSEVNGYAIIGYADQADFNSGTSGTSPAVSLVTGAFIDDYLEAYNASTVAIGGGTVAGDLLAEDASTVNISGGRLDSDLSASGTSTVHVTGGSIPGTIEANDSSTATVSGGAVGAVGAQDAGTVTVTGGTIGAGGIGDYSTGTVTVSGGAISGGLAADDGTVIVSGGTFGTLTGTAVNFYDNTTGTFSFVGTGLTAVNAGKNPASGGTDYRLIGGTLQGGQGVTGDVIEVETGATLFSGVTILAAPEPSQYAALGLGVLGLAGLVLKARRRKSAA